ncbi:hypothetical protein OG762_05465 [Streptomyces sp. NBC_01136]|uniref:hypothetical protein n=1 Tax=unclassified Streptomyces TaxID=2593676 RepID=UPI00324FCB9D|nr:hypothetical protein OG762_05465 [Streptomyces sp. NBC_01136]
MTRGRRGMGPEHWSPGERKIVVCGEGASAKEQVAALLGGFGSPPPRVFDLGSVEAARAVERVLRVRLFERFGHAEFNLEVRRAR